MRRTRKCGREIGRRSKNTRATHASPYKCVRRSMKRQLGLAILSGVLLAGVAAPAMAARKAATILPDDPAVRISSVDGTDEVNGDCRSGKYTLGRGVCNSR